MNRIWSWFRSGLLWKVLLAILACALVPLGVVAYVALKGYSEVAVVAVQGYTRMAEEAIPPSKDALDNRSMESLELRAYDTAQRLARFLYERDQDLRTLTLLPRNADTYLEFYNTHYSPVWFLDETGTERTEDRPLYREVTLIDQDGWEILRINNGVVMGQNQLRDVSNPANTTYLQETYFSETMALNEGEIYVSRVLGWYIPVQEAFAAEENPSGRRYEGVIRFATPLFEGGERIGMVMLSLDHTHVMEFTAHMISTEERYRVEVGSSTGEHSYLIDSECWAISQGRHYYIAGLDENGDMVPPISQNDFAEQQQTGLVPANLAYMGFIDENFPNICGYNQQGLSGSVPIYYWTDATNTQRARALAYATIPYRTGRYNSPAGFGWVAVTSDADKFHEPANLVEAEIVQTREEVEGELDAARLSLGNNTLVILGVTTAGVIAIAGLVARTITRPLRDLVGGAEAIGGGDLNIQVETRSRDEVGQLARAFNQMAVDLKHYTTELARTTAERERLVREMEIGRDIQKSFLPHTWPQIEGVELAATNLPARQVGGDFYDFIPLAEGRLGLVVADVSDKGVPAALFMALSRSLIRAYSMGSPDVLSALKQANAFMVADSESGMFVTLFYAVLDPRTMILSYINAGHNPPILVGREEQRALLLKTKGIALGAIEDIFLEEKAVQLEAGDVVVLYTDGVTEAHDPEHELFGSSRLQHVIEANQHLSSDELIREINRQVELFTQGEPQADDITLMVAKVSAESGAHAGSAADGNGLDDRANTKSASEPTAPDSRQAQNGTESNG